MVYRLTASLLGLKSDGVVGPISHTINEITKVVTIRARDPPAKGITQESKGITKGAFYMSTGECIVSGTLVRDVAFVKDQVRLVMYVNNSKCKKMAKMTKLKVHREIRARAVTIHGEVKEWHDKQVVMAGEFKAPVAKQDPNVATQEFSITCDKISETDTERNRHVLVGDVTDVGRIDDGKSLEWELKVQ